MLGPWSITNGVKLRGPFIFVKLLCWQISFHIRDFHQLAYSCDTEASYKACWRAAKDYKQRERAENLKYELCTFEQKRLPRQCWQSAFADFRTTVSLCVVKVTLSRRKTQVGLHCGAWCWEGKGMRGSSGQVRPPASLGGNKAPSPPSCLGRWQQAGELARRRRRQGGKPCRGGSWGPVSKARRLPAAYHRVPPPTCVHSDLWLLIVPPLFVNCTPSFG